MSSKVFAHRAGRVRPAALSQPAFEPLDRAHAAAMQMLVDFEKLLARLESHGTDDQARQHALAIMGYFNGPGRQHHADEEALVFPQLLASGDESLVAQVHRLQEDHAWLEQDWRELGPQLEAISGGYNWYDLDMLRVALPLFTALYREHIELEETEVYPAAKRRRAIEMEAIASRPAG
jgi:hypothetical protein